jgi:ubiquinone/menaquinone biosynthesis C-methylase UbiE
MDFPNFEEINKQSWNARTPVHVASDFYDMPAFLQGKTSLKNIELDLLPNLKDKKILHLQCHFGQDSLSLSRMGAKVTGVDFSEEAIAKARDLSQTLGLDATFIQCNLYDLPQHLNEEFDLVFTSYGTIGWLPDLSRWADIVGRFLKPGGQFCFVEFHPFVWVYDEKFTALSYHYFNREPIVETIPGTYADPKAEICHQTISWNHPLQDVLNALIASNILIKKFKEYDYSPYKIFDDMIEQEPDKFRLRQLKFSFPYVYAIMGEKGS